MCIIHFVNMAILFTSYAQIRIMWDNIGLEEVWIMKKDA